MVATERETPKSDIVVLKVAPTRGVWRARLGAAVGAVVLVIILAEAGLRAFAPIPPDRLLPFAYNRDRVRLIASGDTYLRFDRDLGWIPTPNRVHRSDGQVFRINSQGLRADHEYARDPPPGVRRLAAFGDSFTHCSEVSQGDCWAAILERTWPRAEVLNFGVPGYGPDQAWLRYQRDGKPFGVCGVLLGYFVGDIERVVNRFRPFIHPDDSVMLSKPRFLLEGDDLTLLPNPVSSPMQLGDPSWAERALGPHDAWYFPGTFVPGPLDSLWVARLARTAAYQAARAPLQRGEHSYALYDEEREAYQVTGRILIQFARQVRADGATPVVLVFPGERDLLANQAGRRPYARLVAWLARAGVPTLDLTDALAAEAERVGIRALFADTHYAKDANRLVARTLLEALPAMTSPTCGS